MPTLVDDRYELLEVLASGGMATVWRARDTRLERLVALKRPHPAPVESKMHERVAHEARAAAGVSHPNLVTLFDSGRDEAGPYLVMELVGGPTLAAPGREIGPTEALAIGTQVADALAAVHEAGIVHRDVKPSNVILSARGPRLTDFGIASIEAVTSELTQPGTVLATPTYAAPEVLAGDPPSPASDVFSLAATVYGLLTGRPPYEGIDRASVPPKLDDPYIDAVIRKGLAVNPDERPSAAVLAAALRAYSPTLAMSARNDTLVMPAPVDQPPAEEVGISLADENAAATAPTLVTEEPNPLPSAVGEPGPAESIRTQTRRQMPGAVGFAFLIVVGLVAWATRSPNPAVDTPTTTVLVTSATTTSAPPTTVAIDPVLTAHEHLSAILLAIGPPDLKPKDRAEIMEKVDEAVVLATNDPVKAAEALRKAASLIVKELGGRAEEEALAALADLAAALGLYFSPENSGD